MPLLASLALAEDGKCAVLLLETGPQKIHVIVTVREFTGLHLKESKSLVEAPKPVLVREGLKCVDANTLVSALEAQGATAEVVRRGEHPQSMSRVERPTFEVKLESLGAHKISVVKVVRAHTGLGLAEVKALVESAPVIVKQGQSRAAAEELLGELLAAGAKASLVAVP